MIQRTNGEFVHLKGHGEWHFVPARTARLADGPAPAIDTTVATTTTTTARPMTAATSRAS